MISVAMLKRQLADLGRAIHARNSKQELAPQNAQQALFAIMEDFHLAPSARILAAKTLLQLGGFDSQTDTRVDQKIDVQAEIRNTLQGLGLIQINDDA